MPPRTFPAVKDYYAEHRCPLCKHLRYADQAPGDSCKFCDCTEHWPATGSAA